MLGEELGSLSLKELQNLEKQLEGALARTRQRKVGIFVYSYNFLLDWINRLT